MVLGSAALQSMAWRPCMCAGDPAWCSRPPQEPTNTQLWPPASALLASLSRCHLQSSYLPVDWDKVRQSCTANPLAGAGADGGGVPTRRPKVVLVTGSAGFVGMHTAMQLRKRGDGESGQVWVHAGWVCNGGPDPGCSLSYFRHPWGHPLGVAMCCSWARVRWCGRSGIRRGAQPVELFSGPQTRQLLCFPALSSSVVLGIDNFIDYYPVSLKRARQLNAESAGVYTGGRA